jgi:hypothetical protein
MPRQPIPRRALLAATLGALYGLLILPAPESILGVTLYGVVWFVLSASLLFLHPIAYHVFVFWGILWTVYRVIENASAGSFAPSAGASFLGAMLDVALPALSFVLLWRSGYLTAAKAARGD